MRFAALSILLLVACARDVTVEVGVPAASDFADPVPVRVADVEVGRTGETGLGPDDGPAVTVHVESAYRDRLREDSEFVLRREGFGTGALYLELLPGDGERAESGHFYSARTSSLLDRARGIWEDLLEETDDAALREEMRSFRARVEAAVEAGRARWQDERADLEAEADALVERLREEGDAAATDLQDWFDETVDRAEDDPEPVH